MGTEKVLETKDGRKLLISEMKVSDIHSCIKDLRDKGFYSAKDIACIFTPQLNSDLLDILGIKILNGDLDSVYSVQLDWLQEELERRNNIT